MTVHIDRFDSLSDIPKNKIDYSTVKTAVLKAGKFSCFEASTTQKLAHIFNQLVRDHELETFDMGYPWTGVRLKQSAEGGR